MGTCLCLPLLESHLCERIWLRLTWMIAWLTRRPLHLQIHPDPKVLLVLQPRTVGILGDDNLKVNLTIEQFTTSQSLVVQTTTRSWLVALRL